MSKSRSAFVDAPLPRTRRVILLTILAVALLVRTVNLDQTPPGIYPDEAQNAYDALRANATGVYQWYYPDNNGREGLMMNLDALSFTLFGVSIWSFRVVGAIVGTLTILGMYLLTRETFWRWRVRDWLALCAAFLMATGNWHIHFSRMNFRAILLPLVLAFAFWLTLRAVRILRETSIRHALPTFLWAGLVFGVGFHTYIAFRIAPAILVALLLGLVLMRRLRRRDLLAALGIFALGTLITAAPMIWTFVHHPEYLQSRSDVGVFAHVHNASDAVRTLGTTIGLSLAQYNVWGDQNWRHSYPPLPLLDPVTGILFLIGLATATIVSIRYFGAVIWGYLWSLATRQTVRTVRDDDLHIWPATHLFLLAWFVVMLAPEFLTVEGLPHALRGIGTLPVVYLLAALGLGVIWRRVERSGNPHVIHGIFVPVVTTVVLAAGLFGVMTHHVWWAENPATARAYNKNLTDIGLAVAALPSTTEKVVIAGPLERLPIIMLTVDTPRVTILYPEQVAEYASDAQQVVIFMTDRNDALLTAFTEELGMLDIVRHTDRFGIDYYTATTVDPTR